MHSRGRADFALRYGFLWASLAWLAHAVFGTWSGGRELVLSFCFRFAFFVAILWLVFWPILVRRIRRSLREQAAGDNGNA